MPISPPKHEWPSYRGHHVAFLCWLTDGFSWTSSWRSHSGRDHTQCSAGNEHRAPNPLHVNTGKLLLRWWWCMKASFYLCHVYFIEKLLKMKMRAFYAFRSHTPKYSWTIKCSFYLYLDKCRSSLRIRKCRYATIWGHLCSVEPHASVCLWSRNQSLSKIRCNFSMVSLHSQLPT